LQREQRLSAARCFPQCEQLLIAFLGNPRKFQAE
jgi:hypothetical protein